MIKEKHLSSISVATMCGLLIIWVLPNTLFLRHVFLGLGSIAGILLIINNSKKLFIPKKGLIPLVLLLSLFLWVGIHYEFFSLNQKLEFSEIKGLWVRVFLGCIMAFGCGISLSHYPNLRKYFFIAVFSVPLINICTYLLASLSHGAFVNPQKFVFALLFSKIETAYFGAIASSIAVANLIYLFVGGSDRDKLLNVVVNLMGLALVLISALVSNTKNGIAISVALVFVLATFIVTNTIFNKKISKKLSLALTLIILVFTGSIWHAHKSFAYMGWDTLYEDAKFAINVDENKYWQLGLDKELPLNDSGRPISINTYERFAYASVGIKLLRAYPLGYGSINRSFPELLDIAQYSHIHQGQVHSGWIDFGLAFGIPGLLCVLGSIFSAIYFLAKKFNQLNLIAIMILGMLLPFCLISEICYKQYFESVIFFIALCISFLVCSQDKIYVND